MSNVVKKTKVLNATIARNKDLFNTVNVLDQKLNEYRELNTKLDKVIIEKYHEVESIAKDLMKTKNNVIAYPLNEKAGTVWLIEIDLKDDEVYQSVGYEIDDKTNMLTNLELVKLIMV